MEATDKMEAAVESLLAPIEEPEQVEEETSEVEEEEYTEPDTAEDAEADEEEASPEDEDEADDDGPEQPTTFKVKVDGEEVEVTLEDLKRSYSGQSYIQKQMQEVATTRKQAQQELQALQAEQERFLQFAQAVQKQGIKAPPAPLDPKLAHTDPLGYIQEQARYNQELMEYQAQQGQMQAMQRQVEAARQRQTIETLQEQARILAERIPEFGDESKRPEFQKRLLQYGVSNGYSDEEMLAVTDARAITVLNKARLWDELQSSKAKAKQAAPPAKNVKPAARRPEPPQFVRRKKLDQARKTGRLSDFADLILE